jgi:hypothetical protein
LGATGSAKTRGIVPFSAGDQVLDEAVSLGVFAVVWSWFLVIVALLYFSTDQDNIGRSVYEAIGVALAIVLIVSAGLNWWLNHGRRRPI